MLVVGEGELLLSYAYVESLVPGAAECEVRLTLQGFESEAELEGLSLQLLDGDTVVAQSTGAFRDFSRYGTEWWLYAQLLVVDGQKIELEKKYSLRIAYNNSDKTLVDGVGECRSQNQPGTSREYSNWRVPLADSSGHVVHTDEVFDLPRVQSLAAVMRREKR